MKLQKLNLIRMGPHANNASTEISKAKSEPYTPKLVSFPQPKHVFDLHFPSVNIRRTQKLNLCKDRLPCRRYKSRNTPSQTETTRFKSPFSLKPNKILTRTSEVPKSKDSKTEQK